MYRRSTLVMACGLVFMAGCADEEPIQDVAVVEAPALPEVTATADTQSYPDTTVDAVWSYLQAQNYPRDWQLWPGKEPLYEGVEPHGALLSTYLNAVAYDALTGDATTMPDNAIIVKENYMPDETLAATTVMYKVRGYDPDTNNWWWLKRNADGSIDGAGRVDGCISCHGAAESNDYVLTGTLESNGMQITQAAQAMTGGQ